ncbi:hypothetical protein pdam_00017537, partial [Pocillopora damicornis]
MCVIPFCDEEACGRCLYCSPGQFLCADHISLVHAGGRSLHHPEVWRTTLHNIDHEYVRDIIAVGLHGQQHPIKIKCCEHEPEAITLVRNGFLPSTPKQSQVAFDRGSMFRYTFLECRIKDICRLLVGDCFCEFRMSSNLKHFNPSYENDYECPACPKEKGSLFISIDALFGCVRKCSAGKSSNHGEELFISQEKVDAFLANYSKRPTSKSTKKLCSLVSLFPLYKSGAGFTDIMYIGVEKKLHEVKNCPGLQLRHLPHASSLQKGMTHICPKGKACLVNSAEMSGSLALSQDEASAAFLA